MEEGEREEHVKTTGGKRWQGRDEREKDNKLSTDFHMLTNVRISPVWGELQNNANAHRLPN